MDYDFSVQFDTFFSKLRYINYFSPIKLAELMIIIEDDMEEIISFVKYCLLGLELFTFFSLLYAGISVQ